MRVLPRLYQPIVKYSGILWNINQNHIKTNARVISLYHQSKSSEKSQWGSKKSHRKVKLQLYEYQSMADPKIEEVLAPLRQTVKEQVSWKFFNLFFNWMTQAQMELKSYRLSLLLLIFNNTQVTRCRTSIDEFFCFFRVTSFEN
jgi:hypothetical protein